jgi:hypothetical protein
VSRYTVDLEQLAMFAGKLAAFNARAEQLAAALDAQVEALHGDWLGIAAQSTPPGWYPSPDGRAGHAKSVRTTNTTTARRSISSSSPPTPLLRRRH